jgi:hypothetical protein
MSAKQTPGASWSMRFGSLLRLAIVCGLGIGLLFLPSVTIGEGAAVEAGTVVTKNAEPYAIVRGIWRGRLGSARHMRNGVGYGATGRPTKK